LGLEGVSKQAIDSKVIRCHITRIARVLSIVLELVYLYERAIRDSHVHVLSLCSQKLHLLLESQYEYQARNCHHDTIKREVSKTSTACPYCL